MAVALVGGGTVGYHGVVLVALEFTLESLDLLLVPAIYLYLVLYLLLHLVQVALGDVVEDPSVVHHTVLFVGVLLLGLLVGLLVVGEGDVVLE